MCGISGICALNGRPVDRELIAAQTRALRHRGPNQTGVFVSPWRNCGLGIRRLSIIDVAGGNQPLCNEDSSIHLVCNGEIYNHRLLRRNLESAGHRPNSRSDAEAVLHGYEAWNATGTLEKLRGMFAFALWDDSRQRLLLARDRFGIKPLYYATHNGHLVFASEIKAILTHPDIPRRVNLAALQAMFTVGFVPGPETLFKGIYKLPPAHFLIAENGTFRIEKYWHLDYHQNEQITEAEAVEQFLALLRESVQMRLMSEVPLGALLSGGLDSGTLVALAQAQMAQPIKTISIGFEMAGYDEASQARALAQSIGTSHYAINFSSRDFDDFPHAMRHLESPHCSATALPIYRLYQTCRQAGLTVVLTGEGADELLGGYHWHRGDGPARRLLALPGPLRRWVAASPLPMSNAARRVLARGSRDVPTRYRDWLAVPGGAFRENLFSAAVNDQLYSGRINPLLESWSEILGRASTPGEFEQMLWLESRTRLPDFINLEVDTMSMAHSIEARVPFLDHKLWEFCASLPARHKLRGLTEKYLLRQATKNILPEATRVRRKKGLAAPYAHWLRSRRLPDWAEELLSANTLLQYGLFNPATVQALRAAHQAGQPNLAPLLMGVLSTQVWFGAFMSSTAWRKSSSS